MTDEKIRENRLRRQALGLGLTLRNSRVQNFFHPRFGGYLIIEPRHNRVVIGEDFACTLDEIEKWLKDVTQATKDCMRASRARAFSIFVVM